VDGHGIAGCRGLRRTSPDAQRPRSLAASSRLLTLGCGPPKRGAGREEHRLAGTGRRSLVSVNRRGQLRKGDGVKCQPSTRITVDSAFRAAGRRNCRSGERFCGESPRSVTSSARLESAKADSNRAKTPEGVASLPTGPHVSLAERRRRVSRGSVRAGPRA
jgi:hypothetical protein